MGLYGEIGFDPRSAWGVKAAGTTPNGQKGSNRVQIRPLTVAVLWRAQTVPGGVKLLCERAQAFCRSMSR